MWSTLCMSKPKADDDSKYIKDDYNVLGCMYACIYARIVVKGFMGEDAVCCWALSSVAVNVRQFAGF